MSAIFAYLFRYVIINVIREKVMKNRFLLKERAAWQDEHKENISKDTESCIMVIGNVYDAVRSDRVQETM